ncbi:hypothetical protein BDV37DRAFT_292569 [Aspergillus pseudonomiae]|uniref:MACPF domain-containing protein n=1 Tax=Aspergillus pseudonomiae TaxID=1506151 RepID=A0A5N7DHV1_9EURO|nr:uncharacterized protein BDV37DRAFT_292569 [Aspergillus pseudonomiae]KAE8406032.1 hypothetical protein BDV37DRAFT_292569 [Aspergillus pseudonomiae]
MSSEKTEDLNCYTVLRVHKYDSDSEASTPQRLIQVEKDKFANIGKEKLEVLRKFFISEKVFDSSDISSPFCDKNGSEMSDSTMVKLYFSVIDEAKEEMSATSASQLNVYFKQKKTRTALDDETKEFLKKQLDLTTKDQKLSEADLNRLKSTFDATKRKATAGSKQSHAADLTEEQWSIITQTNCLFSGYKIVRYEKIIGGPALLDPPKSASDKKSSLSKIQGKVTTEMKVERTPYSGRPFQKDEISADPVRIPRFRVDDDSYVSVYETQNALENSLAKGSFPETAVQASVGGGFWGVSAAASAGFSEKKRTMHITYKQALTINGFRVLLCDKDSLEITEECKREIKKVQDKKSLIAFSKKFGDIFPQRVQLGGALFASEDSAADSAQTKKNQAQAMKVSAAASFSSSWAQASRQRKPRTGQHPPQWCATVGDFYKWRVINQSDVLPLYEALDEINGNTNFATQFEQAAKRG